VAKKFLGPITGEDLADAIEAATTATPAAATPAASLPSPGNT
jgi:hypothetical protein